MAPLSNVPPLFRLYEPDMIISSFASVGTLKSSSRGLSPLKSTVPIVSPFAVNVMIPPLMMFPLSSLRLAVKVIVLPNSAFTVLLDRKTSFALIPPPSR